jgi:hypothetical protein
VPALVPRYIQLTLKLLHGAEMWAGNPGAQKLDKLGSNKQVEVWTKPLGAGRTAALFINTADKDFEVPELNQGAVMLQQPEAGATDDHARSGGGLIMTKCDPSKPSQVWQLNTGVTTNVKSAGPSQGCWEITGCNTKSGAAVGTGYGCKPLPKNGCGNACFCNGAWKTNATLDPSRGIVGHDQSVETVSFHSVMDDACLQVSGSKVNMQPCSAGDSKQQFALEPIEDPDQASNGRTPPPSKFRVSQDGMCVDDGAKPGPPKPIPPPCTPPFCSPGGPANVTMALTALDLGISGAVKVRDVWNKKTLPSLTSSAASFTTTVPHHGCSFYIFMPETATWPVPFKLAPWMERPTPPVPS